MKYIWVSLIISGFLFSAVASASVGTSEQKLNFAKDVIKNNLPQQFSLVPGTLNIRSRFFEVLTTALDLIIEGEADYEYVEFIAQFADRKFYGRVIISADNYLINPNSTKNEIVYSLLNDVHKGEDFLIWVTAPVNLHLKEIASH